MSLPQIVVVSIAAAALLILVLGCFGTRVFFGWYLREARRLKITDEPADAIITYPLA